MINTMFISKSAMVSIIMPAKNAAKYITDSIDSVIKQDYKVWELLVVDDGSIDNTIGIVKSFSAKDPRIKILKGSGKGVSSARNMGLKNARGKYIAFLDSDDTYLDNSIKISVNYLVKNKNTCAVFSRSTITNDQLHPLGWIIGLPKKISYVDMYRCPFHLNTLMYRKSCVNEIFFDESHDIASAEDWLFLANLARSGISYEYIDGVHSTYRLHNSSSVGSRFSDHQQSMENVVNILYEDSDCLADIDTKYINGLKQPCKEEVILKIRFTTIVMALINDKIEEARRIAKTLDPVYWNTISFNEIYSIIKFTTVRGYLCESKEWLKYFQKIKEPLDTLMKNYLPNEKYNNITINLVEKVEMYEKNIFVRLSYKVSAFISKRKIF
jgi:teichuronic acid biosynthesis glycosyltransferase TuaG